MRINLVKNDRRILKLALRRYISSLHQDSMRAEWGEQIAQVFVKEMAECDELLQRIEELEK